MDESISASIHFLLSIKRQWEDGRAAFGRRDSTVEAAYHYGKLAA